MSLIKDKPQSGAKRWARRIFKVEAEGMPADNPPWSRERHGGAATWVNCHGGSKQNESGSY